MRGTLELTERTINTGEGADLVARHKRLDLRTILVSGLTLVSRVLGFVREILSAILFGDHSAVFDAFITAWRVPNLFRRFLGEGAISTSFQTALSDVEGRQGEQAGGIFFRSTIRALFALLVVVCLLTMALILVLPDQMPITGWHWLGADPEPVRDLAFRVMPFVVFICLAAVASAALHVRGRFAAPALGPVVLNLVWIGTLVWIGAHFGWCIDEGDFVRHQEMARTLAWGVLLAGAAQLALLLPALGREGLLNRGSVSSRAAGRPSAPGVGLVLRRAAPLAFGAAVYQINVMVDGFMAEGLLEDGGPTVYYYANRVQQFPLALVAIAAGSAVFPAMQAHGQKGDLVSLRRLHDQTQRAVAFLLIPAGIGLAVLARPILSVSLEHGAFRPEGVERASGALVWLALAVLPAGAMGLVAKAFYSLGDFRTPVRISALVLVLNVALNTLFLVGWDMDVDGLALATAITSWIGLALMLPKFYSRQGMPQGPPGALGSLLRTALAAAASGGAALWVLGPASEAFSPLLGLLLAMGSGLGAHLGVAFLLGSPELKQVLRVRAGRKS